MRFSSPRNIANCPLLTSRARCELFTWSKFPALFHWSPKSTHWLNYFPKWIHSATKLSRIPARIMEYHRSRPKIRVFKILKQKKRCPIIKTQRARVHQLEYITFFRISLNTYWIFSACFFAEMYCLLIKHAKQVATVCNNGEKVLKTRYKLRGRQVPEHLLPMSILLLLDAAAHTQLSPNGDNAMAHFMSPSP